MNNDRCPHCARTVPSDETVRIVLWRYRQLRAAGFDTELATRLATARALDLHMLLDLVGRGCSHELAVRIVDGPELLDSAPAR